MAEVRNRVFCIRTQNIKKLICIYGLIKEDEHKDRSALTSFHWQIIKGRQIIFQLPDVLVYLPRDEHLKIFVISTNEFFNEGIIQLYFEKHNIELRSTRNVTSSIYTESLKYTITAKLSPSWNKIGNYLFKGRDFLINENPIDAISINILLENDDVLLIHTEATQFRLPATNLIDLGVTELSQKLFLESNLPSIHFNKQKLHVFPSMYQASALTAVKKIPESCPLKNYKDICRHWKNLYGYRLPSSGENIFYYEVCFPFGIMTYPNVCVRKTDFCFVPYPTVHKTNVDFFKDIIRCMNKKICGETLNIIAYHYAIEPVTTFLKSSQLFNTPKSSISSVNSKQRNELTQNISLCTPTPHTVVKTTIDTKRKDLLDENPEEERSKKNKL